MDSPAKQVENIKKKTLARLNSVQRAVFLDVSKRIIESTPVDTGRARANWQGGVDEFKAGDVQPIASGDADSGSRGSANASLAIESSVKALSEHKPGQTLVLGNNLEYIVPLEEGSSTQAPNGMVAQAAAAFKGMVEVAARKENK